MADTSGRQSPDPMSMWKQMLDTQEEAWSSFLQQMMGTEAFAASMGRYLDNLMNVQDSVDKSLDRHFRTLNLPSRTDFTRLATEVAELRGAVAALSEQIADLQDSLGGGTKPKTAPPARKPAASGGTRARGRSGKAPTKEASNDAATR